MAKPAHYQGTYHVNARRIREHAYADPTTRCWRCGLTLHQHTPHRNGKPARWTAGHVHNSTPDGLLLPEASTCNLSAGATYGNRLRRARRAAGQPRDAEQQPTTATW